MPIAPRGRFPLRATVAALAGSCAFAAPAGAQTVPAQPATERTVTSTVEGLENLKLLEKGIVTDPSGQDLSTSGLLNRASLDQKTASPLLTAPTGAGGQGTGDLDDLRREQWSRQNWLVDGMRRSELAGDEAELNAEMMGQRRESEAGDETEAGLATARSDAHWLALAIEAQVDRPSAQADTDDETRGDEARSAENPLGDFMAAWLSSDSRRLMADESATAAANAGDSLFARLGATGVANAPADDLGDLLAGATPRAGASRGEAAPNPFLADWDAPAPPAAGSAPGPDFNVPGFNDTRGANPAPRPIAADGMGTVLPAATTITAPADDEPRKASEPWQPPQQDDEKYFPRLKRF